MFSDRGRILILFLAVILLAVVLWLPDGGIRPVAHRLRHTKLEAPDDFVLSSEAREEVYLVGHRGALALKPGNTLTGIETALDHRVSALEIDVVLTGDGAPMVMHDQFLFPGKCRLDPKPPYGESLQRPSARTPFALDVATMAEHQVEQYVCDGPPPSEDLPEQNRRPTPLAGAHFRPVRVREVFEFVDDYASSPQKTAAQRKNAESVDFLLDLKGPTTVRDGYLVPTDPTPLGVAVINEVRSSAMVDRVIVQFHRPQLLADITEQLPGIRRSLLTRGLSSRHAPSDSIPADFWAPELRWTTEEAIAQAKADVDVLPWVANTRDEMRAVIYHGAAGFITDRPDVARAWLSGEPE